MAATAASGNPVGDRLAHMGPAARAWFTRSFDAPTTAQVGAWAAIASGDDTLVVAPTGSGKTLAAFFSALDRLSRRDAVPAKEHRTSVLYISPLKALAVDVERNLRAPLAGLRQESARLGLSVPDITVAVRSGDTPPEERRRQARTPADILITTPESLYLLLTSAARESLRGVTTVIVDEIHAVAGTKRGAHLALSLARLDALLETRAQRIGLSATVRPTGEVARFLGGGADVRIVDEPTDKQFDIAIEVPVEDMGSLATSAGVAADDGAPVASIWPHVEERVVDLIEEHTSTLVFVNSRRLAERITARLNDIAAERALAADRDPRPIARAHHGSVSKEQRAVIEEDLKAGRLPAVVATSSLELGIDMGAVDLVVQVESPPSVASGLQRIGRAGHQVGAVSRGRFFPKYRGDLVQAAVVARLMRERRIEALTIPENPLDVLAQQVIAMVAMDDWDSGELLTLVRATAPYAHLPESAWTAVLDMLAGKYPSDAFAELRPRVIWDRSTGVLSARPGAQRLAVTSGGTIPDRGLFAVHLVGEKSPKLGELDEEMVYEARVGDVFALGASSWRIEDITHDRVLVSGAPGEPGRAPFWHGDALGRTLELGRNVGAFIRQTAASEPDQARAGLLSDGLDAWAVDNLLSYLDEQRSVTGRLPDDRTIVMERCRDELGDWQIVLHSPFGARVHAPWALAIAARLRVSTGMDVQVMHADDGIVLRVPDTEDDTLTDEIRRAVLIEPEDISAIITEQLGSSALFASRFRESAARALLLPKRDPRRRAPLWQQRQRSAQLLAVAAQFADFPIVLETVRECVQDVFDVPGLQEILSGLAGGTLRLHEVSTEYPSPFASSLLFGYIAQYMYEGDSPLAERRAQALTLDTTLLAELLGTVELRDLLDADAIDDIAAQVGWRTRSLRDAEDLADALRVLGPLTADDITDRGGELSWADDLVKHRRAIRVDHARVAAIEDAGRLRDGLGTSLPVGVPHAFTEPVPDPLAELLGRYARTHGPFTTAQAAAEFALGPAVVADALKRLAVQGLLTSGEFRPGGAGVEWCDADVLRRIRRRSIAVLRRQAEPVAAQQYGRFLPAWHGVGGRARGTDAVLRAVEQLAGCPVTAGALETLVLPSRVRDYTPAMLDELTSAGDIVWAGAGALPGGDGWLALAPADAPELLPPPLPLEGADPLLAALGGGGGWFFHQLVARIGEDAAEGFDPNEVRQSLLDLMWAGWVTNDTLTPVRRSIGRNPRRTVPGGRNRGSRTGARRAAADLPGRWSLVERSDTNPTRRAAALAPWLITRHGVVSRGAMAVERFGGGFAAAYKVFTALEDAGRCVRAYAIEGLGAAQFSTAAIVDDLRGTTAPAPPILLAATDPAQPYGAALPWPERDQTGHRPGRKAGAVVVLDDGIPVIYLERGGRTMLTWTDEPDALARGVAELADAVRRGALPPLTLQRADGDDAATGPLAEILAGAGFVLTPRGLRLRRTRE